MTNFITPYHQTDFKRTDQWGSDWLEHDIRNARGKCKACHAATRCADCCFLCENRCDQYRVCEVVKQYAVDAAPYDPSTEQLIDAFRDLQQDRSMRSRIKNLNDYTYKPVVKESLKNESDLSAVQETTSPDNYWEVIETIDEVIDIIKAKEKCFDEEQG